jgi:group I intron endonuclease
MFIYLIVNHITGKYYVGQHKGNSLQKYLQQKFSHARRNEASGSFLYRSMRKHPDQSNWSIRALISGIETKGELDQKEKDFIKFFRSRDPEYGYNICRGGEGHTGPFSLEHRAKIRVNRLAQPDPRLGTRHSEETKKRISEAKRGQTPWMKGKRHTEEAKNRNRQAHILDLRGKQFGNVLPVSAVESRDKTKWAVRCVVCGSTGVVRGDRVRNGDSAFMRAHQHTLAGNG